ncbi:hypothetical protein Arub01_52750 [Actinomadura rubrobrunea]|uniref:Uncharacterized protein n=4 Tax=Actinomadura rubrobrunea TaxID=115335 RepID=A0A9W6Q2I0_9ACTN|nr:hypothetical protein Arub01_52750 [Actinomadura rubrobrunea]
MVLGYGGALVLVAAAVAVLLMPLFDDGRGAASHAADDRAAPEATPSAAAPVPPAGPVSDAPAARPTDAAPRRNEGGPPAPRQRQSGPRPEAQGGTTVTWCPAGSAVYRAGRDGLEVTVNVSASGFARAQVALRSGHTAEQQATVREGAPHTFRFPGVPAAEVERVKITTISVGVSGQTCYARPAA